MRLAQNVPDEPPQGNAGLEKTGTRYRQGRQPGLWPVTSLQTLLSEEHKRIAKGTVGHAKKEKTVISSFALELDVKKVNNERFKLSPKGPF